MSDELTNPDRDEKYRRRREAGGEEGSPDGRTIAEKLYGGTPTDSEKIDQDNGTPE
jgi:hypothetical protein